MNFKSILTRTLPLIIILVLVIGIAVSCTLISTERAVPGVEDGVYATYKIDSDTTVTVSNSEMYQVLKNNGLSIALNWVDKKILDNVKPEGAEESYYQLALKDNWKDSYELSLVGEFEKSVYGEEDDDEAREELLADYIETMVNSGYEKPGHVYGEEVSLNDEERDMYALMVAKKAYAYDQLKADIEEQNQLALTDEDEDPYFTDDEIESYYDSNYKEDYAAIIVSYSSVTAMNRALEQLGIKTDKEGSTYVDWKWIDGDAKLTDEEVFNAFVKLYNNANAYKNGGQEVVDSSVVNYASLKGELELGFDKEVLKKDDGTYHFYYSYDELNSLNSSVRSRVAGTSYKTFFNNTEEDKNSTKAGYTKGPQTYSSTYYLILKLDVVENTTSLFDEEDVMIEDTKNVIVAELEKAERTDSLVSKKMVELRKEKGLKFYDTALETAYINSYDSAFEPIKKENKKAVLEVNGEEYTTAAYFNELSKRIASSYLLDLITKEIVLCSEYNTVISGYTPDMSYKQLKKNVVDEDKWNELLESVQALKNNFAGNAFSAYGFPSNYGWKNFLRDFYLTYYGTLITSDEDLMVYYVYQEALSNWAESLNKFVSDDAEETELQKLVQELMQEEYDKYFSVTGYHLLISVYEEDGSTLVNPLEENAWSEAQVEGAKELYDDIIALLNATSGDRKSALESFVSAYNAAPYYSIYGLDGATLSTPTLDNQPDLDNAGKKAYKYTNDENTVTIEISKYKSLGLSVKYESLSSFGAGKMVEEFEVVAKAIWDAEYNENKAEGEKVDLSELTHIADHEDVRAAFEAKYGQDPETADKVGDYLVTEFGYHVFTVTDVDDYVTVSEKEGSNTKYYQVYVPTTEKIEAYLELLESDEYKAIVEDEDYESGDEDDFLAEKGFKEIDVTSIETYYSTIASELNGNYATSLALVKTLNTANLTVTDNNGFSVETFNAVLASQIKYCIESMTYLGDYFSEAE